jgi:rare lipoprotein A
MQNRRLTFWIYWLMVIGVAGSFGNGVTAERSIAQSTHKTSSDSTNTEAASSPRPAAAPAAPVPVYRQVGVASWYGREHQGKLTASGERFDEKKLTAAHRSLPLDTKAVVTNLQNGRKVEVTVNDRGPYVKGRVLDLSSQAAKALGMKKRGLARVRIEVLANETDSSAVD